MVMKKGDIFEIIYLGKHEKGMSQRHVRIIAVTDGYVKAYCYTRRQIRVFKRKNILAYAKVKGA
ncbi:hypothetical protein EWH99_05425 [Sporolactobacillus sp. THM7-7]|nr:hypothetical protein EWH99_05425 [Sporolactobacillus sp. THM7-7]